MDVHKDIGLSPPTNRTAFGISASIDPIPTHGVFEIPTSELPYNNPRNLYTNIFPNCVPAVFAASSAALVASW
eukprot:5317326-Karenia_brevis.AAC.1